MDMDQKGYNSVLRLNIAVQKCLTESKESSQIPEAIRCFLEAGESVRVILGTSRVGGLEIIGIEVIPAQDLLDNGKSTKYFFKEPDKIMAHALSIEI